MSGATEVVVASASPVSNVRLVALRPEQLQGEQQRLIAWCGAKMAEIDPEIRDLEENVEIARRNKWRLSGIQGALRRARQRQQFYEKVREALDAGYYIVPNFDADVFAIRTTRAASGRGTSGYSENGALSNMPQQKAEALSPGVGDYEGPTPVGVTGSYAKERNGKSETVYFADVVGFSGIAFPFSLALPEVLSATQEAMALRLFDEMAAVPRRRKGDPMVVGRIRKPWVSRFNSNDHVTFLVAWFLDTATL